MIEGDDTAACNGTLESYNIIPPDVCARCGNGPCHFTDVPGIDRGVFWWLVIGVFAIAAGYIATKAMA